MWGRLRRAAGAWCVVLRSKNKGWEQGRCTRWTLSYGNKLTANGPNSHSSVICEGWGVVPQFCVPALNPRTSQHGHLFSPSFSYFLHPLTPPISFWGSWSPTDSQDDSWSVKHGSLIHSYTAVWLMTFFHMKLGFGAFSCLKLIILNNLRKGISSFGVIKSHMFTPTAKGCE